MSALLDRLALLRARRTPPPSTDAAELVASFRPVTSSPPAAAWDPGRKLRGARVAVVDTETTGIDWREARIVEVAVVVIDGLGEPGVEPVVVYSSRVRPGIPIPEGATKIHGIGDADVAEAPTWSEVWPVVRGHLEGCVPAAFNAPYDGRVIAAECARHKLDLGPAEWGRWLDAYVLGRGLDQYEKGKKLLDIARRRGIVLDAHGAAGDAMVTAMLLPALVRETIAGKQHRGSRFQGPAHPTVGAWLAWQRDTALEQERDFAAHLRTTGRREAPDMPWHELEGVAPAVWTPPPTETGTCQYCRAPIVWVVGQSGRPHPCDPPELRAVPDAVVTERRASDPAYLHQGRHVALVLAGGDVRWGHVDADGELAGRESHWSSCPQATRARSRA